MNRRLKPFGAWVALLLPVFAACAGETRPPQTQPAPQPHVQTDEPPQPRNGEARTVKDPTQLSPRMRELLAPKNIAQPEAPRAAPVKLPQITLRGLVAGAKDGDGSAAIEVKGGGVYLVRQGSTVQAATENNQSVLLQVKSVGKDAIVIEVPELQQTLTIR